MTRAQETWMTDLLAETRLDRKPRIRGLMRVDGVLIECDSKDPKATLWSVEWGMIADRTQAFPTLEAAGNHAAQLSRAFEFGKLTVREAFYTIFPPPPPPSGRY